MVKYRRAFFLADLVVMIAFSGLALAFMRAVGMPANVIGITLVITLSVMALKLYRLRCEAPTCDKCGRQFHRPSQKPTAVFCPECGQPQIGRIQPRSTLAIAFWVVLVLLSLVVFLVSLLPLDLAHVPIPSLSWAALPLGMMVLAVLFCILFVTRSLADSTGLKPAACTNCGYTIPPKSATGPLICARCLQQSLPEKQLRKQQALGFGIIFVALLLVGLFAGFMVPTFDGSYFGMTYWIVAPLVVLATVIGVPVALFVALFARTLVRLSRLRTEAFILTYARKVAGDDGQVLRSAHASVWYSGPTNPKPLLMEQMEATALGLNHSWKKSWSGNPLFEFSVLINRVPFWRFSNLSLLIFRLGQKPWTAFTSGRPIES